MSGIFGLDMLRGLASAPHVEQVERIAAFDAYDRGMIAHIQGSLSAPSAPPQQAAPKLLRLKVPAFEGKEGENLHFWVRESEIAMDAALITDERLRVAFALSNLGGRAKSWAYTRETMSPGCFASWPQLCEELRATFLPVNMAFRQRSAFLACKQGKKTLHEYVQEMRVLASSLVGDPLPKDVKLTVFMEGLRVGPARTQLYRVQASSMEEAFNVALQEEYSHNLAKTPGAAAPVFGGAEPMELGTAQQSDGRSDIRCYGCGKLGHMKRSCPSGRRPSGGRQEYPAFKGRGRWPQSKRQGNARTS